MRICRSFVLVTCDPSSSELDKTMLTACCGCSCAGGPEYVGEQLT